MPLKDKIERLVEDGERTMFDASVANELIDIINALRRLTVKNGKVTWSDANVVLEISGSAGSGTTPSSNVSGSTFISSSIYCISRWN